MTTRPFSTRPAGVLAATVAVLAVLAGCSDPSTPTAAPAGTPAATAAPSDPAAAHNAADAAFVQGMIPHHRQAIDMSGLAAARAASPKVKDLAARISTGQSPEIEQMNRMLTAWGMTPGASMPGMGAGSMGGMGGMMNPDQMRGLEATSGPAFDRSFLQMMIEHHTGAIQMARTELAQGQNPEAKQLAQAIIDTQQAEILQMQSILGRV